MIQHRPPIDDIAAEEPARILAVEARLKESIPSLSHTQSQSLWDTCQTVLVEEELSETDIVRLFGRSAIYHAKRNLPEDEDDMHIDSNSPDVYWSAGSWCAARIAAQAVRRAVTDVLSHGHGKNAFCLVRPPGHHCFNLPEGFCILNNVVAGADVAIEHGKRVAILDWDYHFGDGTALHSLHESYESVMFASLHAKKRAATLRPTYPPNCKLDLKGDGLAKRTGGRCWNIQWEYDDADDAAFTYALETVIVPTFRSWNPDIILISAGYDAVKGDALAGMELSPSVFYHATRALQSLGVPVVAVLEGGYDCTLLAESVWHTVRALLESADSTESTEPTVLSEMSSHVQSQHRVVVDSVRDLLASLTG